MTFRNHTATLLALATLTGCAMAPAHADAWTPGHQFRSAEVSGKSGQLPPGDNLGYQPAPSVVADWPMDPPMPVPTAGPPLLASWRGAPAGWNPPGIYAPSRGGGNNNGGNLQTGGNGNGDNGCGNGNSGPNGEGCNRPDPPRPEPAVPGPAGLLGVGAMFTIARQLRRRIIG